MNSSNRQWVIMLAGALIAACLVGICLLTGGTAAWTFLRPIEPAGMEPQRTVAPSITPTSFIYPRPTYTRMPTPERPLTLTEIAGMLDTSTPPAILTSTLSALAATIGPALLTPTEPPVGPDVWCLPWNPTGEHGRVTQVIDGVTIEVEIQGVLRQVRYLGLALLDASEHPEIFTRALEQNRLLVENREVLLISDHTNADADGRLLRYVFAGGKFINYELINLGYANADSMPPNVRCDELLLEAEARAIQKEIGLWAPQPTVTRTLIPLPSATIATTGDIVISFISERGTLWQEPEEFVEIRNDSDDWIQLEGWSLTDEENHVFIFPRFYLNPGGHCRVYTNEYHAKSCGFSYWSGGPIWSNDRECAYLKNSLGELVATLCYE